MTAGTDYWATAEQVCTPLELDALRLRDQHGYGYRRISRALGTALTTTRDRLESADRKIAAALNPKEAA